MCWVCYCRGTPPLPPQDKTRKRNIQSYKNVLLRRTVVQYSADSQEADGREAIGAERSSEYPRHQLSHREAVDLPRKNQMAENARRTSPCAGERHRPVISETNPARR